MSYSFESVESWISEAEHGREHHSHVRLRRRHPCSTLVCHPTADSDRVPKLAILLIGIGVARYCGDSVFAL
jgi:hypothetical protein